MISAGGSGIHRPIKRASKKCQESLVTPGTEYQAKKAKGDVKKKGKPDPYAYLPLSRKVLNRRWVSPRFWVSWCEKKVSFMFGPFAYCKCCFDVRQTCFHSRCCSLRFANQGSYTLHKEALPHVRVHSLLVRWLVTLHSIFIVTLATLLIPNVILTSQLLVSLPTCSHLQYTSGCCQ